MLIETRMGRVDSMETTRRLKAHHPEVIVVVLTACDDEDYIADMFRAGAGSCLLKSIDAAELVKAIRLIRAGLFVSDPAVEQRILKRAARPHLVAVDFGQHLTRRESEILKLAVKGLGNQDIGLCLGITERTVKGHFSNILGKMGVSSRTAAVTAALKRGWVNLDDE